ncbi:MAG: Protein containing domain, partial [Actinomycetia bacterium]|nr:Protein containing domain [Actinomycetes bacterium]
LTGAGLEPRRSILRTFAVARGESYAVMPGGLTRVAAEAGSSLISNQSGAVSKDTWVLASEPEPSSAWWLRDGPAVRAIEPAGSMPSRAAENLFWLGRYAERAESVCRLLRVVHDRRNEFATGANPAGKACVNDLLGALTHVTATYPGFLGHGGGLAAGPDAVGAELAALTLDSERAGTLAYAVRQLLDAAHAVRDQLSSDTWLVVADLDRDLLGARSGRRADPAVLGRVMRSLLALAGLGAESMVRDPGWRFLEIGRRLERGLQLTALLRAIVTEERDTATDSLLLESALTSAESIITYRRRYRSHAQLETVLDLLLLDPDNPRSLAYQVQRLAEETDVLPGGRPLAGRLSDAGRAVLQVSTTLRLADTAALAQTSDDGRRQALDGFLTDMAAALTTAGDAVTATHFTHLLPQRPMGRGMG